MKHLVFTGLALSLPLGASARRSQDEPPDINFQFKVNQAIDRGMGYLKAKRTGPFHQEIENGNELILLTYLHAGAPEGYPGHKEDFEALLNYVLESKLERTYKVALTAMCLEEYERAKYQWRLHQCAQFLADNVSDVGHTRYGEPSMFVDDVKSVPTGERKAVSTSGNAKPVTAKELPLEPHQRQKPPVRGVIHVKRQRAGPADHDHSNMQYHALGLRACHDAGIRFETSLLKSLEDHWRDTQLPDPNPKPEPLQLDLNPAARKPRSGSTNVLVEKSVAPAGWGYIGKSRKAHGSMTVGAVGALCILDYLTGKDWREDKDILEGLQWMNKHWSVTENPEFGSKHYYYYMYGMERVGMLFDTEVIGSHKWYREGAEQLLKDQKDDGSWGAEVVKARNVVDTCFAILFLRRATRRLDVVTGERR